MKFGMLLPSGWRGELDDRPPRDHWHLLRGLAERAEQLGFDSVWAYDHLLHEPVRQAPYPGRPSWPIFEAWTLLAGLAASTRRVRLGQLVTNVSLRPPAYLAQVAANLDLMSDGRLIVGLGAGWNEDEHRHLGLPSPSVRERLDRLEEVVRLLRDPGIAAHSRPPILIGGGGEKRTLRIAAAVASFCDFGGTPSLGVFRHKAAVLGDHCAALNRSPEEITLVAHFDCLLAGSERELADADARLRAAGRRPDDATLRIAGTPPQVVEALRTWQEAGCGYAILYFPDALDGDGPSRFAAEVAPQLTAAR